MKRFITFFLFSFYLLVSITACIGEPGVSSSNSLESEIIEQESVTDVSNSSDNEETFDSVYQLTESMEVIENKNEQWIRQTDTINGITYSLTLCLDKASGFTTEEQLVICTRVFWYCYPQMYELMATSDTPTDVNLLVENEGYEVAEQWDNNVHLHDQWLWNNPNDFDCLTHEFAHVIQTNWSYDYSPQYLEESYLIERFADACRYIYAYEGGIYNDISWTFWTADVENHYSTSNRFWVWLELNYSNDDVDIFERIVEETQIMDEAHEAQNWDSDGSMWNIIFKGTAAEGKTLDQLWDEFIMTDYAYGN